MPRSAPPEPPVDVVELAEAIAVVLEHQLQDLTNDPIVLTRDEAIVARGLVNAVIDSMKAQR